MSPAPRSTPTAHHLDRNGAYLRVAKPEWADPFDTSFSRRSGGRWNPPGVFGVLYLNRDQAAASANARRHFAEQGGFSLLDLKPEKRPIAIPCLLKRTKLVDVLTDAGITALGLPVEYPWQVPHSRCRPIGRRLHQAEESGVAVRSAAECPGAGEFVGEEAAIFDHAVAAGRVTRKPRGRPLPFEQWYRRIP